MVNALLYRNQNKVGAGLICALKDKRNEKFIYHNSSTVSFYRGKKRENTESFTKFDKLSRSSLTASAILFITTKSVVYAVM